MLKKVVETIVGGAIGMIALYAVAKVAYSAGQDVAKAEYRHSAGTEDPPEEKPKKVSKLGMLMGLKRMSGFGKQSALGDIFSNPEDHRIEAYVKEGEVHIDIKKSRSMSVKT